MAGSSPLRAFEAFVAPLQQAIKLVVPGGRGVLAYSSMPLRPGAEYSLSFPNDEPVRLAAGGLFLELVHSFRIIQSNDKREIYNAVTTGYWYGLLDQDRRELIAYHHHPTGESWCTYPHLHVPTATKGMIGKAHLVTGPVTLQTFIRMLIEDPAIPVVSLRPDWASLLAAKGDRNAVD